MQGDGDTCAPPQICSAPQGRAAGSITQLSPASGLLWVTEILRVRPRTSEADDESVSKREKKKNLVKQCTAMDRDLRSGGIKGDLRIRFTIRNVKLVIPLPSLIHWKEGEMRCCHTFVDHCKSPGNCSPFRKMTKQNPIFEICITSETVEVRSNQ